MKNDGEGEEGWCCRRHGCERYYDHLQQDESDLILDVRMPQALRLQRVHIRRCSGEGGGGSCEGNIEGGKGTKSWVKKPAQD